MPNFYSIYVMFVFWYNAIWYYILLNTTRYYLYKVLLMEIIRLNTAENYSILVNRLVGFPWHNQY